MYSTEVDALQKEYYASAKRYTGQAFQRARLKATLRMDEWDPEELFEKFDTRGSGVLSMEELHEGFATHFKLTLTPENLKAFGADGADAMVDRERFVQGVQQVLNN
jgi:hypothetical protein